MRRVARLSLFLVSVLMGAQVHAECTRWVAEIRNSGTLGESNYCTYTVANHVYCPGHGSGGPGSAQRIISVSPARGAAAPCDGTVPNTEPLPNHCGEAACAPTSSTMSPTTLSPTTLAPTPTSTTTRPLGRPDRRTSTTLPRIGRPYCGNGRVDSGETCDQPRRDSSPGGECCSRSCQIGEYRPADRNPGGMLACYEEGWPCLEADLSRRLLTAQGRSQVERTLRGDAWCSERGCCVGRRLRPSPRVPPQAEPIDRGGTMLRDPEFNVAQASIAPLEGARVIGVEQIQISTPDNPAYRPLFVGHMLQSDDWLLAPAGGWFAVERCGQQSQLPEGGLPKSAAETGQWLIIVVGDGPDPRVAGEIPKAP